MTMCLPLAIAAWHSLMPVAGSPVASITTSISGCWMMAMASSVTKVAPLLSASAMDFASVCSFGQPTSIMRSLARAGIRSARPVRCMPVVRRTWERNMVPNLPAPIWAMRTGRLAAARSFSRNERFTLAFLGWLERWQA